MSGFSISDFFVSLGFQVDTAAQKAAERSMADYERVVREAETRVEEARKQGLKASVQIRLLKDADLARQALAEKQAAAKTIEAEEAKEKALAKAAKAAHGHSETFVRGMTAITLAAGTMGLAVAAAVGKVSQVFDNLYFASQRTGASVRNLQGIGYAFSQVGSTSTAAVSAVESFAKQMRTSLTGGFIRSLGVATEQGGKARDTFDVLSDTIDAITARHPYHTGAQMAEILGLSEEQFETFAKHRNQIKEYRAEYERMASAVGLNSDEAAKQSEHFQQTLRRMGAQVGAAGQAFLIQLLPALERMATALSKFLTENAPALQSFFQDVGKIASSAAAGVERFFGEDGQKRVAAWGQAMRNVADAMRGVWRVIEWIGDSAFWKALTYFESPLWKFLKYMGRDTPGAPSADTSNGAGLGVGAIGGFDPTRAPSGSTAKDERSWWQRHAPKFLGGKDAPSGTISALPVGGGTATGHAAADAERAAYIRETAKRNGIDPEVALRVAQSEGFRKYDGDPDATGKATSFGDYQLHYPGVGRNTADGLGSKFTRETGLDARDPSTWKAQIDFALKEAKRSGWGAWHGAARAGIGDRQGLDYNPATAGGGKQVAGNVAPMNGVGGLDQKQGGATRSQPITDALQRQIVQAATAAGVNAEIYSGGQDEAGPNRTGSHRHDHGNAADLKLYTLGPNGERRYLSMNSDTDRGAMEKFIRESVKAGANGVGAALDYMGENGIHVGGGSPSAWGAGGSSSNAPDWVRRAHQEGLAQRAAQAKLQAAPISTIKLPELGRGAFNPGGYDVNKITAGQPMGSASITSTTNNAGATVTMQPQTHVTIHGGDPASNAAQFERSANRVNDLALRNAQTAIR